jgi:hypothetical protein
MLFKQDKNKKFDYTPLYYRPEKDPEVKRRKRIHFPRSSSASFPFTRKFFFLFLLIIFILYVLKKLAILF